PTPQQQEMQTTESGKVIPGESNTVEPGATTSTTSGDNPDIFSKKEAPVETETPREEAINEDFVGQVERDIIVETDLYTAVFTNKGAGLKTFTLKKYKDDLKEPLNLINAKVSEKFGDNQVYPFYFSPFEKNETILDINKRKFHYDGAPDVKLLGSEGRTKTIEFKFAVAAENIFVVKRFTFHDNSYVLGLEYKIIKDGRELQGIPVVFGPDLENNRSEDRGPSATVLTMGFCSAAGEYDPIDINTLFENAGGNQKSEEQFIRADGSLGTGFWSAFENPYFAAIFKSQEPVKYSIVKIKKAVTEQDQSGHDYYSYISVVNPGLIYLGPKDEQILATVSRDYDFKNIDKIVSYGWAIFSVIAKLLLQGILFIYSYIPNYGWALVILTIIVKIILFPLTYKSSESMAKMQTLQPKIKAIKKKYKNLKDPAQRQAMNKETMDLYKAEKVNPAGGCLPMLLQMPVLFAFFQLLPKCINFRHEPWILWVTDLSLKDPIYALPILMGVTQIIVTKMSPTSGDANQKKMMYLMPVVMVFLFMNYSAGLNLYWFISNLLQIGQQHIINKKIYSKKKEEDQMKRAQKKKKGVKAK
ncbi:MAG: membrane protein insertase YidC, partial [bacterium]|nr:membrane protein insertase YidC [bacterium]